MRDSGAAYKTMSPDAQSCAISPVNPGAEYVAYFGFRRSQTYECDEVCKFGSNDSPSETYLDGFERVHSSTVVSDESKQPATGEGGDNDSLEDGKDFVDRLCNIKI
jgi:hypothetical protein